MSDPGEDLELWNAAAERYEEILTEGSDWRQGLVLRPAILEFLGNVGGQEVLDAGSGPGLLSIELARQGARVTAVDASERMVTLARQRVSAQSEAITVLQADLCCELPFQNDAFDAIACNMVLMDIREIDTVLAEFCRVLRPSGRLVFSITHPCFFMWFWEKDEAGNELFKPVDDYLTIRSDMNEFWGPTRHYHRPLTYYFAKLHSAGFLVDDFVEPVPACSRTPELEHVWRVPDFVVMRALPRGRAT
ncbi:MAG: methyltransferase domain-containing protein [Armatimonadota bacterium]|nr:MAG: methyltransferase domain-containing protein [Armatimonadota bacterium]